MRAFLREPLVHFLAIGLLLFAFFEWRSGGAGAGRIVVGPGQVEHLAAGFTRTWQRPPTEVELKGLLDEHLKEEMAFREAVAEGLDRDDAIIRRRLRQKLEFLAEDAADQGPPDEAALRAWLAAHPGAFRTEPQVALRQVFVSPAQRGASAPAEAARLLARLQAAGPAADTGQLGDATSLPADLPLSPAREVGLIFGDAFARGVEPLPEGRWAGPVESSYGLHLVLVQRRVAGGTPDLADVRPQVEREVVAERRRQALDALYRRLLARYAVVIEMPAAKGGAPAPAAGGAR